MIRHAHGFSPLLLLDLIFFAVSTSSVMVFYLEGQRHAQRPNPLVREWLAVLPIGLGISLRNAVAVTRGLVKDGGEFRRTPKRGDSTRGHLRMQIAFPWLEGTMALFFAGAAVFPEGIVSTWPMRSLRSSAM